VHLATIFGKPAGELFAGNQIRRGQLADTGDGIVIGDGDKIHAALLRLRVDLARLAVTLGALQRKQHRLVGFGARATVAMQIHALAASRKIRNGAAIAWLSRHEGRLRPVVVWGWIHDFHCSSSGLLP
jgi:hypothetical protein